MANKAADTRQTIRFCTARDGVRLAYATSGGGPPIVKASNWMGHLEFDWGSPVWHHVLAELSRRHTLLRYDPRGSGLSDWQVPRISFEDWVADLETVVEAAGVDKFPLIGISQGAAIAIAYTVRHPERVTQLVLHGGFGRGWLKRGQPTPQERDEAEMMAKLAELGWGKENPAFRQFFTTQFIPDGTPEQVRWFNELERVSMSPANASRHMRVVNEIDVVDLAPQVRCPTLVLHADRDARAPFNEGRLLASLIPGARFVPLDSRNHLPLKDEPAWQRWLEEVPAFLGGGERGDDAEGFAELTPREREIVELIAQGCDNAQIAAHLTMSEKTVRNHITRVFEKLEVENRGQAIVKARDSGFGRKQRRA